MGQGPKRGVPNPLWKQRVSLLFEVHERKTRDQVVDGTCRSREFALLEHWLLEY